MAWQSTPVPDALKPTEPLEYEQRSAALSRRQFRILPTLTLLNTVLLAGFVGGPVFIPYAKAQWRQFQLARAERRRAQQQQAAYAQALNYNAPADQVVLEENPDAARKLLAASSAYRTISANVQYFPPQPWQPPVVFKAHPLAREIASLSHSDNPI